MDKLQHFMRWKRYNQKMLEHVKKGNIKPFSRELFDALRPYHYGGTPMALKLFVPELNNGSCYDCASYLSLAFPQCQIIYGDVEYIRLHPTVAFDRSGELTGDHAVVYNNGKVYDTTQALEYTWESFKDVQMPNIRHVETKDQTMRTLIDSTLLGSDFYKLRWWLLESLPMLEDVVNNATDLVTQCNKEFLLDEIAKLKAAVKWDELIAEDKANKQLSREAFDKKYDIIRGKNGQEISRGGEPNLYYDIHDKNEEEIEQIYKAETRMQRKYSITHLKKVRQNPTKNVYEM